jgi:hypothetical protein
MATFSCYAGQVIIVAMLLAAGIWQFERSRFVSGTWLLIVAMATVIFWQCFYTVQGQCAA